MSQHCLEHSSARRAHGDIDSAVYFDGIMAQLGSAWPEAADEKATESALDHRSLDPITLCFNECIQDDKFKAVGDIQIQGLKALLVACWAGDLSQVQDALPKLVVSSDYSLIVDYLYQALVRIACTRGQVPVLEYLLSQTPAASKVYQHDRDSDPVISTFSCGKSPAGTAVWDVYLKHMRPHAEDWNRLLEQLFHEAIAETLENASELIEVLLKHGLQPEGVVLAAACYCRDISTALMGRLIAQCPDASDIKLLEVIHLTSTDRPAGTTAKLALLFDAVGDLDYMPAVPQKRVPDPSHTVQGCGKYACEGTVLHHAAFHGNKGLVALLLRKGVGTEIRDSSGKTASDVAEKRGFGEIRSLIEEFVENPLLFPD